ncbi:MAG: DUF2141 domain-containing protein [Synechococcales cyanobacterium]
MSRWFIPVGLLLVVFSHAAAQPVRDPVLTVQIEELRRVEGLLCLAVFSGEEGFPDRIDQARWSQCQEVSDVAMAVSIPITYGSYAITVFHDENSNGEMDTGTFGIPKEGFGFSSNPKIRFAQPTYSESRIAFTPDQPQTTVRMRYF